MAKYGLGSIPITTTIANYGTTNEVSVKIPAYIAAHWGAAWNNGEPFVAFNQYTQDGMKSTDFATVEAYFESVEKALGSKLEVFVGETGYSTYWGASKQATVYKQIVDWLGDAAGDHGGKTVPLFVFDAFDRPAVTFPADEAQFGIYGENGQSQPTGLKTGLVGVIPNWTSKTISVASSGSDSLYGRTRPRPSRPMAATTSCWGWPATTGCSGRPARICWSAISGDDVLRGGRGDDFLDGGRGGDDPARRAAATIRWSAASTGTSCRAARARTSSSSISR